MTMQSRYNVRRAEPADLRAVLAVLAEGTATRHPDPAGPQQRGPASDLQQAAWDRMMRTVDLSVYIAERDGVAVGTATMLIMPHLTYDCRPTAFIEAVVVRHDHRRRGVARQLLDHAVADARHAGCLKVQLLSHKRHADDGAHRLYVAAGFTAEAEGFRLYLDRWHVPS
jgi:GNAT superfamily N-acetyltransferase